MAWQMDVVLPPPGSTCMSRCDSLLCTKSYMRPSKLDALRPCTQCLDQRRSVVDPSLLICRDRVRNTMSNWFHCRWKERGPPLDVISVSRWPDDAICANTLVRLDIASRDAQKKDGKNGRKKDAVRSAPAHSGVLLITAPLLFRVLILCVIQVYAIRSGIDTQSVSVVADADLAGRKDVCQVLRRRRCRRGLRRLCGLSPCKLSRSVRCP